MARKKRRRSPLGLGNSGALALGGSLGLGSGLALGTGFGLESSSNSKPIDFSSQDSEGYNPLDTLVGAGKVAIDILQAPSRAVGGTIAAAKKDGFQPLDLGVGLTRAFNDDYDPSKVVGTDDSFLGGLATDIALDPLTYLSAGLYGAAKGAATGAVKGGAKALADDALEAGGKAADEALDLGKQTAKAPAKKKTKSLKSGKRLKKDESPQIELSPQAKEVIAQSKKVGKRQQKIIQSEIKNAPDDLVQARVSLLKPFGMNIPGVSDALSIPISKTFSKTAARAKFADKAPALESAYSTLEKAFIPNAGVPKALSNAERAAGNMARAQSEQEAARISKLVKEQDIDVDRATTIRDYTQKMKLDLTDSKRINDLRKSQTDEAREFIKTWDETSDNTKQFLQDLQQQYKDNAIVDLQDGLIDNTLDEYFPAPKAFKADQEGPDVALRSTEDSLRREQGFQKQRKGNADEETLNVVQSHLAYVGQRSTARQALNLSRAIDNEFGQRFANAEDAANAGFLRPKNKQLQKFLGEDAYVPAEIADGLDRISQIWSSTAALNDFTRKFGQLNGAFKSLAYTSNPGHFLVDSIGDTWNMWIRGIPILDPTKTTTSIQVMNKMGKRLAGDIDNEVVKIGNQSYELDELIDMANSKGLLNFGRSADRSGRAQNIGGDYVLGEPGRFSPRRLARRFTDRMQVIGNWRDNRFRLAGQLNQLQKNLSDGMDPATALHHASNEVRIAVFDYNDLTTIEKRIFRNLMPFYTWTRKNIPYQIQSLGRAPGKVMLPFNVQEALVESSDVNEGLIPSYIRDQQFLLPEGLSSGIPFVGDNPLFVNPMIPSMDLGRFQDYRVKGEESPIPGINLLEPVGMLSPFIKAPFELGAGREFYTNQPIDDLTSYALRTFGGQTGAQFVRQADNPSELYDRGPLGRTQRQTLGLTGQILGLRGYSYNEPALRAQAHYRLADIASRLAQREAERERQIKLPLFNIGLPGY